MADPTPWYQFDMPESENSMANPDPWITSNFEKIRDAGDAPVIAYPGPLPNIGAWKVGDRIYMSGANSVASSYICVAQSTRWGAFWKPVQACISPWQVVPATAITNSAFQQHPTIPWAIALDNMGRLWSRGALQVKSTDVIPGFTSTMIFDTMPDGIRVPSYGNYNLTLDPVDMTNPATTAAFKGGRLSLEPNGNGWFRLFNVSTSPKTTDIWMSEVKYATGRNDYQYA